MDTSTSENPNSSEPQAESVSSEKSEINDIVSEKMDTEENQIQVINPSIGSVEIEQTSQNVSEPWKIVFNFNPRAKHM